MLPIRTGYSLLAPAEQRRAALLLAVMVVAMIMEMMGVGVLLPFLSILMRQDMVTKFPLLPRAIGLISDHPSNLTIILAALGLMILLFLVKTVVGWGQIRMQMQFAFCVQHSQSEKLFKGFLNQPHEFHLTRNSSELFNFVTSEAANLSIFIINCLTMATDFTVVAGIFAFIVVLRPLGATLLILLVAAIGTGFYRFFRKRSAVWGKLRMDYEMGRALHIQQALGGIKEINLLGRSEFFLSRFQIDSKRLSDVLAKQAEIQNSMRVFLEFFAMMFLSALIISMVAAGEDFGSIIPTLGLFGGAAFRCLPSLNRLLAAVQSIKFSAPCVERIAAEHAKLQADSLSPRDEAKASPFAVAIEIRNLVFQYSQASRPALNGLSLTIRKGQMVGVIGSSGSGKSTLVDVLLGLLRPQQGEILIDGVNLEWIKRGWQRQIGYVPQTIYLTDDTLRRNIALGVPDGEIREEAVLAALRDARLADFVASLPDGLDTFVGERGVRLSGGQRQRIGIARALYHAPSVLFLDEATSALDNATEAAVMEAINALSGQKTVIIVAHRITTIQNCDICFELAEGGIIRTLAPGSA